MKRLLQRLLLAAGATVVALVLGWAVLLAAARMHAGAVPRLAFRPALEDDVLGQRLRPDWHGRHLTPDFDVHVRTNAFGQRGGARTLARAPGVRRILLLGDSFAFGWGVEEAESFAVRLGALLTARTEAPGAPGGANAPHATDAPHARGAEGSVEIVNAGVPAWNVAHAYVWLTRGGFDWQPDLVLLELCSNDLAEFAFYSYELDARHLPVAIRTRPRLDADERRRLIEEAAAAQHLTPQELEQALGPVALEELAADAIDSMQARRREAAGAAPEGPIESLTADEVRRGLDTGPAFQARFQRHVVDAIAALCAARGVPLRTFSVDARTSADGEDRALLSALCADLGERCLPSDAYIPRADFEECFFRLDPHWTVEGHRRAGEALAAWLAADPELPFARR